MAEAKLPREPDQRFVGRLVPDPAAPPELRLLAGYPGASSLEGHTRLYASPDLGSWWEIPEDAVLHRQAVAGDPLGAEILWIRRDQEPVLRSGRTDSMYTFPTVTYFGCPTGPVQHQQPTWGYGCGHGPVQHQPFTFGYPCGPGPVQHQPFTISGINCPTTIAQTPVGAGAQAQAPTQNCTLTLPTVGCHHVTQYCGTTPVGAAALPPTFFSGLCTVPPPSTGCHVHDMVTVVRHPTVDFNCGTSPVGAAQAQPQPSLHYPTVPPHTVCCR